MNRLTWALAMYNSKVKEVKKPLFIFPVLEEELIFGDFSYKKE